jgi:transcriptional regulator
MPPAKSRNALPQGSLDMLILRTLLAGPQHGYAIARHLHKASDALIQVEEGSLYPALHRLEHRGLIKAEWGPSEANRKAKYYSLTRSGKKALDVQTSAWQEMQRAIGSIMNYRPVET